MKKRWYLINTYTPKDSTGGLLWYSEHLKNWMNSLSTVFAANRKYGYQSDHMVDSKTAIYRSIRQIAKVAPEGTEIEVSQRFYSRKHKKRMERVWTFTVKNKRVVFLPPPKKGEV